MNSSSQHSLFSVPFEESLLEGAHNALHTCLRLSPQEKITIITDEESKEIGASLLHEVAKINSPCAAFILEDFAQRPMTTMPVEVLEELATSQVSIFCAQAYEGELKSRMEMTSVVSKHHIRHGHMVNINKQIMLEGMRADFLKVDELSSKVHSLVSKAKYIKATTEKGTAIEGEFSPRLRWFKTSGLISSEKWGNLPGGEVFTAPYNVNGTFIIDGVVGDYLCKKYGNLKDSPCTVEIRDSRMKEIYCSNKELENELWKYCHTDENSDRVGEFAIGTNIAVKQIIGHILQDEKFPGIHLAFGHPYAEYTGADWISSTHIDVVGTQFNIWIDDFQIMSDGKFLI
jgi:leucyl aminopeptidase (aminopeptidase T)